MDNFKVKWDDYSGGIQLGISYIGSFLDNACMKYALSKMEDKDFVPLLDTKGVRNCNVGKEIGEEMATIKISKTQKFMKYYEGKMEEIATKIVQGGK